MRKISKIKNLSGLIDLASIPLYLNGGQYSASNLVRSINRITKREDYLGKPAHNYDFTQSEEWANLHGYYPDERGHRDDRVKKESHPTHPSRGRWKSRELFDLTDKGASDVNYILYGLNDGGQDPQATMTYRGGTVLPEFTVTPKGNYIYNSYDNINVIPKYQNGGETVVERTLPEIEVYGDQLRKDLQRTGLTYDELSNLNYGAQRLSQIQRREEGVKELAYNAPVTGDVLSLYDVGKDVYEGNYSKAAIGAGLFFLPNIIERPIKNAVRRIGKWVNAGERLNRVINIADQKFLKDLYNLENIAGNAEDLISKKEKELIKSNVAIQNFDTDKKKRLFQRFKESLKQYLSDQTLYDALTGDYYDKLDEDSQRLFIKLYQEDPQYLLFAINNDLPINSNSTVQQFAKKQESSLRGAFIPEDYNYDKVYDTLTRTYSVRTGGDRMHSRNGVYISNSRDIQNVFSRRQSDDQLGYAIKAALTTNFLPDASKSISDQLYDLRRRYLDYDIIRDYNPDTHNQLVPYDYLDMLELYDLGYKGIEGQYVRRNGSRLPVYERAMFNTEDRVSVLNIDDAIVSDDIENLRGRWGVNASGADYTDKEFVHRSPGGFKDLLGYYRILDKALERIPIHLKLTKDELLEFNTQLYGWWNDKIGKAHDKYNTSKRRLDKLLKTQLNRNKNIKRVNKVVNETNKLLKPSLIGLTLYNSDLLQNDPNEEMNNYIKRQQAIKQRSERIKQTLGYSEGGIHIKKKNRGKFTETMKRTGKSAEELKHSKNPLTRKRATFAINARKWAKNK